MEKNKTMEHISNVEKANEIAQSVSFFWTNEDDAEKSIIDTVSLRKAIFNAVMQAMELKDEYYKKLLDLLVESGADADIITNYIKNCIEL